MEVDETLGQLLVAEGFSTIEEISKSSIDDISKIQAYRWEYSKRINRKELGEYLIKEKEDIGKKLKDLRCR